MMSYNFADLDLFEKGLPKLGLPANHTFPKKQHPTMGFGQSWVTARSSRSFETQRHLRQNVSQILKKLTPNKSRLVDHFLKQMDYVTEHSGECSKESSLRRL
jgi:hypothetical protein